MKIPCNGNRKDTICLLICLFVMLMLLLGIRQYSGFGLQEVVMITIVAYFAVVIGCIRYFSPERSYRFSRKTLEILLRERVVWQWDLESVGFRVLKGKILINNWPLPEQYGRAFEIISRRLIRLAQQGHVRMQPEPVFGWRENLRALIIVIVFLGLRVVPSLALMFGVAFGSGVLIKVYCFEIAGWFEMFWGKGRLAIACLLFPFALYLPLSYAIQMRRWAFERAVFTFLGRVLGIDENSSSHRNPSPLD